MAKRMNRCAVCWALAGITGIAAARTSAPWDGAYVGFNVGDGSVRACDSWALKGETINSTIAPQFTRPNCSHTGALVSGIQIGETFQYKRLVWGIGADVDYWAGRTINDSFKYSGTAPPPGSYTFSSKETPSGFAIISPRIGYAGDTWLPYLRVGGIFSAGAHKSDLFYTPTGSIKPTASFSGGTDFSTVGWVAGGGFELGLNGAWSITAEYLHASLGKGSDSTGICNGAAAACAAFSGVSLGTSHEGSSANIFRIGITCWFDYWGM